MQTIRDNRIVFFFSPLNITSQGTIKYVRNRHTSDLYIFFKNELTETEIKKDLAII